MLIVLANRNKKIIFTKHFGDKKEPLAYLLAYSALDTEESFGIREFTVEQNVLCSGHKIIIAKEEKKLPRNFFEAISEAFLAEMLNPLIDCDSLLSDSFEKSVESIIQGSSN
ncbi:hypothetical protein GINT2_000654 [Glugoides intestinalis]